MKKIKLFHLKNQMFVANGIANFIGVLLANASALTTQEPYPKEFLEYPIVHWTDALFDILDKFIGEVKLEDDITSVVIKI